MQESTCRKQETRDNDDGLGPAEFHVRGLKSFETEPEEVKTFVFSPIRMTLRFLVFNKETSTFAEGIWNQIHNLALTTHLFSPLQRVQ